MSEGRSFLIFIREGRRLTDFCALQRQPRKSHLAGRYRRTKSRVSWESIHVSGGRAHRSLTADLIVTLWESTKSGNSKTYTNQLIILIVDQSLLSERYRRVIEYIIIIRSNQVVNHLNGLISPDIPRGYQTRVKVDDLLNTRKGSRTYR